MTNKHRVGLLGAVLMVLLGLTTPQASLSALASPDCAQIQEVDLSFAGGSVVRGSGGNTRCYHVTGINRSQSMLTVTLEASGSYHLYMAQGTLSSFGGSFRLNRVRPITGRSSYSFPNPFSDYTIAVVPVSSGQFGLDVENVSLVQATSNPCTDPEGCRSTQSVRTGLSIPPGGELTFPFSVACPGEIRTTIAWQGNQTLDMFLDAEDSVRSNTQGTGSFDARFTVSADDLSRYGSRWAWRVSNPSNSAASVQTIDLYYPNPTSCQQERGLYWGRSPNYGTVSLAAGFVPDPHTQQVTSGGDIDVGSLNLGPSCYGFATRQPDFRLQWSGTSQYMRIYFLSDQGDTTLIVNDPHTNWRCNDDSFSLNPEVVFNNPSAGQYDIWVGSYTEGQFISGTLYISELSTTPAVTTGAGLDPSLESNYGSVELTAGFSDDPFTQPISSGGPVNIGAALGNACQGPALGFATRQPDFKLYYTAGGYTLRIFFVGGGDTTMVVNAPNGQWYCNDDVADTLNPMLEFSGPSSGRYDIWVGSYAEGESTPGTLYITERTIGPGDVS